MSVDTTFTPLTPTFLVGVSQIQVAPKDLGSAVSTYRVRCLTAAYLTWGPTGVTALGAPGAGGTPNTIGLATGGVIYLQVPPGVFFISSVAASFEITGGQGGCGG